MRDWMRKPNGSFGYTKSIPESSTHSFSTKFSGLLANCTMCNISKKGFLNFFVTRLFWMNSVGRRPS
jgi:hypothetical protein